MIAAYFSIIRRELLLARRQGGATLSAMLFFILTVTLFPLGVGPAAAVLERISAGTIWVAALLAVLLSLDRLFQADLEDGTLEQMMLLPMPVSVLVLAKVTAHWITTGLPLIIASPLLGVFMQMSTDGYLTLVIVMALGTPTMNLIGAIGAALTVGVRRGGVLLSMIVIPLYIPILIFGVAAVEASVQGYSAAAHMLILTAMLLGALVLAPIAAGWALKLAME